MGNCCHGDSALSYCANVSHLLPYLVCDMDACKMVRLKALHLSPLPSKLVHLGQSFLAACFPFLPSLRLSGQSLSMERKSCQLRTRRPALCGLNGWPRSSDIWWQLISKAAAQIPGATNPWMGNGARAPSTFLQETKPVYKWRSCSHRPQLHPASITIFMHTDPRCRTLASRLASVSPEHSSSHMQMMGSLALFFSMSLSYPRSALVSPLLFLPNTDSTCIQGLPSNPSSPTKPTNP